MNCQFHNHAYSGFILVGIWSSASSWSSTARVVSGLRFHESNSVRHHQHLPVQCTVHNSPHDSPHISRLCHHLHSSKEDYQETLRQFRKYDEGNATTSFTASDGKFSFERKNIHIVMPEWISFPLLPKFNFHFSKSKMSFPPRTAYDYDQKLYIWFCRKLFDNHFMRNGWGSFEKLSPRN